SLRETPEDIPILANHFLQKHCATLALEPKQLSPEALERLCAYRWPGNARQLENEIKRLVASVRGRIISEEHIAIPAEPKTAPPASGATPAAGQSLSEAVEALERRLIQEALQQAGGQRIRFASPPATPKRSRCPRELSKRRILARLRTDRKPKRESARRRWTGRYRLLLKRSFAARCAARSPRSSCATRCCSARRRITLEIALRSLA